MMHIFFINAVYNILPVINFFENLTAQMYSSTIMHLVASHNKRMLYYINYRYEYITRRIGQDMLRLLLTSPRHGNEVMTPMTSWRHYHDVVDSRRL